MEKHHIVFRSQGGLNYPLNLVELTTEEHRGNNSPHKNRVKDLELKRELQNQLFQLFPCEEYSAQEIAQKLGVTRKYVELNFKRVPQYTGIGVYKKKDIIRKLMGGKFY